MGNNDNGEKIEKINDKVYERELVKLQVELVKLQEWIKDKGLRVVVLFEGRDAMRIFQLVWSAVHGLISLRIRHPRLAWMPAADHVDDMLVMIDRGLARPTP